MKAHVEEHRLCTRAQLILQRGWKGLTTPSNAVAGLMCSQMESTAQALACELDDNAFALSGGSVTK